MSRELILQDVKSFLMQGTSTWAGEERGEGGGGRDTECAGEPGKQKFKNAAVTPAMMGACQPHAKG